MQYVQHISTVCRYLYSFRLINFSGKKFLKSVKNHCISPPKEFLPFPSVFIPKPALFSSQFFSGPHWLPISGLSEEFQRELERNQMIRRAFLNFDSETWFWTTILHVVPTWWLNCLRGQFVYNLFLFTIICLLYLYS